MRELRDTDLWRMVERVESQRQSRQIDVDAELDAYLFREQLFLLQDPHRFVSACAGRRAGKSTAVAVKLLKTARRYPDRTALYLNLSRLQARGVVWGPLRRLAERFELGATPNETTSTLTLPNGGNITLMGVNDRAAIENKRGYGFSAVVIDESQSVPDYLSTLVDDVLAPALADVRGQLVMIGTPSALPQGYWYDCAHGDPKIWGHHAWTARENPFILDFDATVAEELERRGVEITDPSIRREWFGEWIRDESAMVFPLSEANWYDALPIASGWRYVIGGDLGLRDADALAVLAYHPTLPNRTYLVDEEVRAGQDVTGMAEALQRLRAKYGPANIAAIVLDAGGLGAKIVEELRRRYRLPVTPAHKADKTGHIQLMASAIRRGDFLCRRDSRFAAEAIKVEWDWEKSKPDKLVYRDHMFDLLDAAIYAFVESRAWTSREPAAAIPADGTPQRAEYDQQQIRERAFRVGRPDRLAGRGLGMNGWEALAFEDRYGQGR